MARRLRTAVTLSVAVIALFSILAHAQEPLVEARGSVDSWLGLIDGQRYAESWQAAAAFFRNAVPAQTWAEAVRVARIPLGPLKARTVKSATQANTLPGAPDGEYVVFQFNTSFEQKASAIETVTAIHESDGKWRVVGYFVR